MSDLVRGLVLREVGAPPALEELELMSPQRGEVRVAIRAVGVCHSDLSVASGVLPQPVPCVLGHEASGVVTAVGEGVSRWSLGDRVIVQWVPMCRTCASCMRGEPWLCTTYLKVACRMDDGTTRFRRAGEEFAHALNAGAFADEIVVRETGLAALPDDVPFEIGALIGCGLLTGWGAVANVATVQPDEHVAVFGAGGVGLDLSLIHI